MKRRAPQGDAIRLVHAALSPDLARSALHRNRVGGLLIATSLGPTVSSTT